MNDTTNTPTPPSVTGRRRRFTGAHPYPALPQSRLPLLRGVLWVTWAGFLALVETVRAVLPGNGRSKRRIGDASVAEPAPRAPRMPSLTPTG
jgi:hypothetical protein